jgi:hypothetical protein
VVDDIKSAFFHFFLEDRTENSLNISLVAWTDEGRVGPIIKKSKNLKKKG